MLLVIKVTLTRQVTGYLTLSCECCTARPPGLVWRRGKTSMQISLYDQFLWFSATSLKFPISSGFFFQKTYFLYNVHYPVDCLMHALSVTAHRTHRYTTISVLNTICSMLCINVIWLLFLAWMCHPLMSFEFSVVLKAQSAFWDCHPSSW